MPAGGDHQHLQHRLDPSAQEHHHLRGGEGGAQCYDRGICRCLRSNREGECHSPGPFLTDIAKAWDMEALSNRAETAIAMKRGGRPGAGVAAALYIGSDHASYTTGALLRVDGGSHCAAWLCLVEGEGDAGCDQSNR